MIRRTLAGVAAGTLLAAAPADAHVTIQPKELPAGEYKRIDVRVPNERDNAGTTKVSVQFPPGFASASYEPVAGWSVKVARRKAAEPIDLHGETVDEEIDTVTFTARDGRRIPPGAFQDFGLSVRLPEEPGETLTFKATQTYEGGEVVRWIGPEDADEPAPTVKLVETATPVPVAEPEIATAADDDDDDGDGNGLAIAALVVGGLGLATGGAALATSRRRTA